MLHRFRALALLGGALLATACSDERVAGPAGGEIAPHFSTVAASCAPATIRATLAQLLTDGGSKAFAIPHFNAGQQADLAGNAALAEQEYFRVVNHVIDRYARGGTAQPRRYESVQAAVVWVVLALYDCADAELPIPAGTLVEIIDDIGGGGPGGDIAVAAVGPGIDFDVLVPSRQFSFVGGGDFWDGAGLVIVSRIGDSGDWSDGVYNEHPPRYNIAILPYTAQANFDDDGNGVNGPEDVIPSTETLPDITSLVSVCPGAGHAGDHTEWFILRRAEPFLDFELEELPPVTADPDVICDESLPPYEPATEGPILRRGLASLRGAASALLGMLGPAPLYAVDGGIGGRVRLASDYVSAMEDEAPPLFLFSRPLGSTTESLFAPVSSDGLTVLTNSTTEFAASSSSATFTPIEGGECDLSALGEDAPFTAYIDELYAGASTGSGTLQATCGGQEFVVPISVLAPPPIGD